MTFRPFKQPHTKVSWDVQSPWITVESNPNPPEVEDLGRFVINISHLVLIFAKRLSSHPPAPDMQRPTSATEVQQLAPEKCCLEDDPFLLGWAYFQGWYVKFPRCISTIETVHVQPIAFCPCESEKCNCVALVRPNISCNLAKSSWQPNLVTTWRVVSHGLSCWSHFRGSFPKLRTKDKGSASTFILRLFGSELGVMFLKDL